MIFGIVIGWAMGFLRLPYLEKNYSFLLGFVTALAFISLVLLLWRARNRELLSRLTSKKTANGYSKDIRTQTFIWIVLLGVLVLGGGMLGGTIYRRNEAYKVQIQNRDRQLQEMAALVETLKKNDLKPLMNSLLGELEAELKNVRQAVAGHHDCQNSGIESCVQNKYLEADSLSEKAYSPERGQLLQALVLMQMDTASFAG